MATVELIKFLLRYQNFKLRYQFHIQETVIKNPLDRKIDIINLIRKNSFI